METIEHIIDDCECTGKRCKDCQKLLCRGAFNRNGGTHLRTYCKVCQKQHNKEQYWKDHNLTLDRYRDYYHKNPSRSLARSKKYHQGHSDEVRTRKQVETAQRRAKKCQAPGSFTVEEWRDLNAYYKHTCLCCGKQEPEITITVDHVIPFALGGSNDITNIQPLCYSCNAYKKRQKTFDYRPTWQDNQEAG